MSRKLKEFAALLMILAVVSCVSLYDAAAATPTVSGASGAWNHGGSVTLTVTNAGTKAQAAPRAWDNGVGTGMVSGNTKGIWNVAFPFTNVASQDQYNLYYRTAPYRSISGPHSEDSGLITGAHDDSCSACLNPGDTPPCDGCGTWGGNNVGVCKTVPVSMGDYVYMRWYEQKDPNWVFRTSSADNFKDLDVSLSGYFSTNRHWFVAYQLAQQSCGGVSGEMTISDLCTGGAGTCIEQKNFPPDGDGGNEGSAANMCGNWVLVEYAFKISNVTNGGEFYGFHNGQRKYADLNTITQNWDTGTTSFCAGGYARGRNINNYRYFDDLYIDTLGMVLVCDSSSIADYWSSGSHGTCHPQPASSWSASSITVTVNKAGMTGTKYVYVFNDNGEHNVDGWPVTMGAGASPQCSDGQDNDLDGDTDYPADSGCASAAGTDERECGDDFTDTNETCDGTDLNGLDCLTVGGGFTGGTLACNVGCGSYDTSSCTGSSTECDDTFDNDGDGDVDLADSGCVDAADDDERECGDDYLDAGETCDTNQLNSQTCISQGFAGGGTLACNNCGSFDTSGCYTGTQCDNGADDDGDGDTDYPADDGCANAADQSEDRCGDNYTDPTEVCDGTDLNGLDCTSIPASPYVGGTLSCESDCSDYDRSFCTHGTSIAISGFTDVDNVDPNATTYTFSHTHDEGTESGLVVTTAGLGDSASDACNVTGITFNGDSMTLGYELPGAGATKASHASIWHLYEPDQVTGDIVVTFNGDKCNRFYANASSFINVDPSILDDAGGEIEESGGTDLRWTTSALETNSMCNDIVIVDGVVGTLTPVTAGMTTTFSVTSPDQVRVTHDNFTTTFNGGWDTDVAHAGVPWIYIGGCYLEETQVDPPDPGQRCEGVTLEGVTIE